MAIEQANAEATPARVELLKRKSRPSATAVTPKQRPLAVLGTNDSGETPPDDTALQDLYRKFPGLKQDLIKSIQSKFIPSTFFKLRYTQGPIFTLRRS